MRHAGHLTQRVTPGDNQQTPAKIALGHRIFFDGRLSADGDRRLRNLP
ncbi:MAG TPA: hypothetical protein VN894_06035 [Polyangiaceae bacterium]|nr:hypothetical protein [Polyangiaceae bacterium]